MTHEELIDGLSAKIPSAVVSTSVHRGECTIVVRKDDIVSVCTALKEVYGFDSIRDLCGLDMNTPGERFFVVYTLYSTITHDRVRLKTGVEEEKCVVPSVTGVWPAANWLERETYDMFGISFSGHPDLRRIYMPEEFEYHPLRKDFPLMGVPDSIPLPKK